MMMMKSSCIKVLVAVCFLLAAGQAAPTAEEESKNAENAVQETTSATDNNVAENAVQEAASTTDNNAAANGGQNMGEQVKKFAENGKQAYQKAATAMQPQLDGMKNDLNQLVDEGKKQVKNVQENIPRIMDEGKKQLDNAREGIQPIIQNSIPYLERAQSFVDQTVVAPVVQGVKTHIAPVLNSITSLFSRAPVSQAGAPTQEQQPKEAELKDAATQSASEATKPEVQAEAQTETNPEVQAEAQTETNPEVQAEAQTETKSEEETETKADSKSEEETEAKVETKTEQQQQS